MKTLGVRQVEGLDPLLLNLNSPSLPHHCFCALLPFLSAGEGQLAFTCTCCFQPVIPVHPVMSSLFGF